MIFPPCWTALCYMYFTTSMNFCSLFGIDFIQCLLIFHRVIEKSPFCLQNRLLPRKWVSPGCQPVNESWDDRSFSRWHYSTALQGAQSLLLVRRNQFCLAGVIQCKALHVACLPCVKAEEILTTSMNFFSLFPMQSRQESMKASTLIKSGTLWRVTAKWAAILWLVSGSSFLPKILRFQWRSSWHSIVLEISGTPASSCILTSWVRAIYHCGGRH